MRLVSRFDGVMSVHLHAVEATRRQKGRRNETDDVLDDGLLLRVALDVLLGRVGEHARRRPVLRRDDEFGGRAHAVEDLVVVAPQLAAVEHDARAGDLRAQFLDDARLGQLDVAGGHDVLVSSVMERHAVLFDVVGVAAHQT